MTDAATSLDRLHDIVEPSPVPWWPPAPGWYVVIAFAVVGAIAFAFRCWKKWHSNAYRREALRELQSAETAEEIAELLRRTALAIAPRATIASLSGEAWPKWLAALQSQPMPEVVERQLAGALYEQRIQDSQLATLRTYAKAWIERHRPPARSPE